MKTEVIQAEVPATQSPKKITADQWKAIESELSHPYGQVELLCDGYKVSLCVEQTKKLQYSIITYVNGIWKGIWMRGDADEAKRFLRPVESFVHSPKVRSGWIKACGGKRCPKADLQRINKKFTIWHIDWKSVRSMRRHFEKNNSSLEVISIGFKEQVQP